MTDRLGADVVDGADPGQQLAGGTVAAVGEDGDRAQRLGVQALPWRVLEAGTTVWLLADLGLAASRSGGQPELPGHGGR